MHAGVLLREFSLKKSVAIDSMRRRISSRVSSYRCGVVASLVPSAPLFFLNEFMEQGARSSHRPLRAQVANIGSAQKKWALGKFRVGLWAFASAFLGTAATMPYTAMNTVLKYFRLLHQFRHRCLRGEFQDFNSRQSAEHAACWNAVFQNGRGLVDLAGWNLMGRPDTHCT